MPFLPPGSCRRTVVVINIWLLMVLLALSPGIAAGTVDDALVERAFAAWNRGDTVQALRIWEQLADEGDKRAMVQMGLSYQIGDKIPPDYKKAMDWYLRALDGDHLNDGDALNNIGVMYRDASGVRQNRKIAYLLFLTVHMQGLGGEETVMRANRNLRREIDELPLSDTRTALCYTVDYVRAYLRQRGNLVGIPKKLRASTTRPRFRELNWWSRGEMTPYDCPDDA